MQAKVKILYIASDSRSGSTLIDLMLGQAENEKVFSLGELRHLWERSYMQNELCGCTRPFRECGFWADVTEQAFGSIEEADRAAAYFAGSAPTRIRHMPALMTLWRSAGSNEDLDALIEALGRVYTAIRDVSGASVIVDSSKVAAYGLIISRIPTADVSILHLVRDSRAVAYSWQRKKLRTEVHWKQEYMPRFSLIHSARAWMLNNMMIHALIREVGKPSLFARYEDAVAQPDTLTGCVSEFLAHQGIDVRYPSFASGVIPIRRNHTVAGNPLRINDTGEIRVRADAEWERKMQPRHRQMITALTAPLLKRYGYLSTHESTQHIEEEPAGMLEIIR